VTSSQVAPGRPGPPRPDEPAGGQDAGDREGAVTGGQVSAPAQALTGSAPSPAGGAAAGAAVGTLTTEQCDLLDLLAAGHSIAEAARMRYLSLRTANRRVADARATLGVPTTREAVLAYLRLRGR
jgi:DNA-binding NarL/FixJ family response regulator